MSRQSNEPQTDHSECCKLNELIRLVHPRDGHHKVIAMIEAYFDESGIHDSAGVCIVAGYFGRAAAWRRLEKAWRSILGSHNFPLEKFHAKNLAKAHRYQGMLEELVTAIAKCDLFPISAGVVVDDFKNLTEAERKWFTGGSGKNKTSGTPSKPYFYPFQMCVVRVTNYTKAGEKAHFFFGCDRPFAEYAVSLFKAFKESAYSENWQEKKRLGDISFPQAKETPQLQAADLFAHLTYLHWIGRNNNSNWKVRPTGLLATCLTKTKSKYDHVYTDKKCFDMTVEKALSRRNP